MLIVTAINVTGLDDEKPCDYEVAVSINSTYIWQGTVTGHMRADGWAELLRRIADTAEGHFREEHGGNDDLMAS